MPIVKTLVCSRCGAKDNYEEREKWRHCYLVAPKYSPGYNEDQTLLCPKCLEDYARFLEGRSVRWWGEKGRRTIDGARREVPRV